MVHDKLKKFDAKEIELPETIFVRDIESRVFQSIALQCLAKIEGIAIIEGNLIDNLLGRDGTDRVKGIYVEQDQKNHSVNLRIEVNIVYGVSIPAKAEEIQNKIAEEVSELTGLHVGSVHVIFKNLLSKEAMDRLLLKNSKPERTGEITVETVPVEEGLL